MVAARVAKLWLGALASVVSPRHDLVFERGFLASCVVRATPKKIAASVGDPAWSTVRAIRFDGPAGGAPPIRRPTPIPLFPTAALLADPTMRALREVTGVGAFDVFLPLANADQPLPLTALHAVEWVARDRRIGAAIEPSPAWYDVLGEARSLPSLRRLGWEPTRGFAPLGRILDGPLGARLEELTLAVPEDPRRWLLDVEAHGRVPSLSLLSATPNRMFDWRLSFDRVGQRFARLRASRIYGPGPDDTDERARSLRRRIDAVGAALEQISVDVPRDDALDGALAGLPVAWRS